MRLSNLWVALILAFLPAKAFMAQDLNDIISRHLKARGGEAKIRALVSLRLVGTLKSTAGDGQFEMLQKRPNYIRQQHTQKGKKLQIGYDGKQAWAVDSSTGSENPFLLSGIQAELIMLQSDFDGIFLDWRQKGHNISLVGMETLNGRKVHHLKVQRRDGRVQHFFLDAETYLDQKISLELSQEGSTLVVESLLSDHKAITGISFPYSIESVVNGRSQSKLILEKIELDPILEDNLFKMPAPVAPDRLKEKVSPPKVAVPAKNPKPPAAPKN